jgi:electron transfer flavoprotein alpha subunit
MPVRQRANERMVETLVLIEHDRHCVKRASLRGITLARQLGGEYALLVLGHGIDEIAASLVSYGASAVVVADDPALSEPLADRYAAVIVEAVRKRDLRTVVGTSSTFSKDVLPRAAALLDVPMVTDVLAIEEMPGSTLYRRPVNAGSMFATVKLESNRRVLTARATAFETPAADAAACPIERFEFDVASLPKGMEFISREQRISGRPDLTEAAVVVCGGRPMKDKETFERLVGGLADALGGAVGATRAAVDAGMAPNDYQVGQTGKVIAPQLYIGIGISGAIQHLAGIKDSRVIVAINKDPDAPIFQVATYGLVGDLHQIVPQFIDALRRGEETA